MGLGGQGLGAGGGRGWGQGARVGLGGGARTRGWRGPGLGAGSPGGAGGQGLWAGGTGNWRDRGPTTHPQKVFSFHFSLFSLRFFP